MVTFLLLFQLKREWWSVELSGVPWEISSSVFEQKCHHKWIRNVALSKMLSVISFIFLMYNIEENSLQDHLRNHTERLKFVISSVFILCLHLPLLSYHHFSPKLLFPRFASMSFLSTSLPVPLPPAFPSPTPWASPSQRTACHLLCCRSPPVRGTAHRSFLGVSSFASACSSPLSLLSANHSLSDFPSSGLFTRFFCLTFRL